MVSFFARRTKTPEPVAQTTQHLPAPEPLASSSRRDADLMDLVEDDVRRSQTQTDAAYREVGRLIDRGAGLSADVVTDAEALAATISSAVADVDALSATFADIEEAGRGIASEVDAATRLAGEAQDGARRAGEGYADLRTAIARIETVVGLIAKVAKQTNLLALNATIEAERAGVLGRGFAVVASEVKTLSTETQRATDEISRTIASLQVAAERSGRTVEDVVGVISRITPTFAAVAEAVERQERMIGTAAERADHVRTFVDGVSNRAEGMRRNSIQAAEAVGQVRTAAAGLAETNARSAQRLTTVLRQSPASDRRKHDRFPVTLPVAFGAAGKSIRSQTVDISLGGVLVLKRDAAPGVGQRTTLDLTGIGRLPARLVAQSAQGLHFAFEDLSATDREAVAARVAAVQHEYQPLIDRAIQAARQIGGLFGEALSRGEIGERDLFDVAYRPIPDTDPQQFETASLRYLERVLPPLQEALVKTDPRMVFCAAVDRNGYLPVHNVVFSQPQRKGDPVWNAANCRNRRIFDDRTGLLAARNTRPFIVQAYSRDMGGGVTVLMKEIDAPIEVAGRHWGGFRTAYKF